MYKLSDNINLIQFNLLECQVDIVLHSLELFAYNLHFMRFDHNEDYDVLNSLLYHTYEQILATYSNNQYRVGYNVLDNCLLEIKRLKKKNYLEKKNFYKKIA